jgi:hypothetical protein
MQRMSASTTVAKMSSYQRCLTLRLMLLLLHRPIVCGLCRCEDEVTTVATNTLNDYIETVNVGDPNATKTIVIGYLMDQINPPYRIGAIAMAIADAQANGLVLGYNFK